MIILTTSHRPTRRVRSLCKDLASSIPGLIRVNRGKMGLIEVAERAVSVGSEKFIVIDRWKGCPGRIRFYRVVDGEIREEPPRIY
ncbi:MAG: Brix domain containing protein, partial [Candidatus Bathyarchaeia archaeon]